MSKDSILLITTSTQALLDELMSRYENGIFTGIKANFKEKGDYLITRRWKGSPEVCVGLIQSTSYTIIKEAFERYKDVEDVG